MIQRLQTVLFTKPFDPRILRYCNARELDTSDISGILTPLQFTAVPLQKKNTDDVIVVMLTANICEALTGCNLLTIARRD